VNLRFPCETVVKNFLTSYRHSLIKALAATGWTQQKIAESLSLTQAAVSNYLKKDLAIAEEDKNDIEPLVRQSLAAFQKGDPQLNIIMDAVCKSCKIARSRGEKLCELHMAEIPVLRDEKCMLCSKYLDKAMIQASSESREILEELAENFNRIKENKKYASIIPEVQSNLVLGSKDPGKNSIEDYAGFPGRIIHHGTEAKITGYPAFGASKHIARIVSIIRSVMPGIRSATCIVNNQKIESTMAKLGMKVVKLEDENDDTALRGAVQRLGSTRIDAIVFTGKIGLEPLTYVLGESATIVIDKLEKLLSFL